MPGTTTPARFLTYLVAAVRTVRPNFGEVALALLRSADLPARESVLNALLNDLCAENTPLSLVLDDYHLITERAVHEAMTYLLEHLPAPVHFVIASRTDPPLPLSRLRVRGELIELRATDLRCSGEEVETFFGEVMGLQLSEKQRDALSERTEGWLAGLQLAALSLAHQNDKERFIAAFTGSNRLLWTIWARKFWSNTPEHIRRFLKQTAFLPRFPGHFARR